MFRKPAFRLGAFCLCYGAASPSRDAGGEPLILVLARPGPRGRKLRACNPGGHASSSSGNEDPRDTAVRELQEEMVDPNGIPVLPKINPARLSFIASGIEASKTGKTLWHAFACPLFPNEMQTLRTYTENFATDPAFAQGVVKASRGEVGGARLVPVGELLEKIDSGKIIYGCAHGKEPVLSFLRGLRRGRAKPVRGKELLRLSL